MGSSKLSSRYVVSLCTYPCSRDDIESDTYQFLFHLAGNIYLRDLIGANAPRYLAATSKPEKGEVIDEIIADIQGKSPTGTGFVKLNKTSGRWRFIGREKAKDKVGHALRKALLSEKNLSRGAYHDPASSPFTKHFEGETKSMPSSAQPRSYLDGHPHEQFGGFSPYGYNPGFHLGSKKDQPIPHEAISQRKSPGSGENIEPPGVQHRRSTSSSNFVFENHAHPPPPGAVALSPLALGPNFFDKPAFAYSAAAIFPLLSSPTQPAAKHPNLKERKRKRDSPLTSAINVGAGRSAPGEYGSIPYHPPTSEDQSSSSNRHPVPPPAAAGPSIPPTMPPPPYYYYYPPPPQENMGTASGSDNRAHGGHAQKPFHYPPPPPGVAPGAPYYGGGYYSMPFAPPPPAIPIPEGAGFPAYPGMPPPTFPHYGESQPSDAHHLHRNGATSASSSRGSHEGDK